MNMVSRAGSSHGRERIAAEAFDDKAMRPFGGLAPDTMLREVAQRQSDWLTPVASTATALNRSDSTMGRIERRSGVGSNPALSFMTLV